MPQPSPLLQNNFLKPSEPISTVPLPKTITNFNSGNKFNCDNYMFDLRNRVSIDSQRSKHSSTYIKNEEEYLRRSYQQYNELESKVTNDVNMKANLAPKNTNEISSNQPNTTNLSSVNNPSQATNQLNQINSSSLNKPSMQGMQGLQGINSSSLNSNPYSNPVNNGNPLSNQQDLRPTPIIVSDQAKQHTSNSFNSSKNSAKLPKPQIVSIGKNEKNTQKVADPIDKDILGAGDIDLNLNTNNDIADDEFEI